MTQLKKTKNADIKYFLLEKIDIPKLKKMLFVILSRYYTMSKFIPYYTMFGNRELKEAKNPASKIEGSHGWEFIQLSNNSRRVEQLGRFYLII